MVFEARIAIMYEDRALTDLTIVIIGLVMYVSGRLNKIKQNRILFILILLLIIADNILRVVGMLKIMETLPTTLIVFFFNTTVL